MKKFLIALVCLGILILISGIAMSNKRSIWVGSIGTILFGGVLMSGQFEGSKKIAQKANMTRHDVSVDEDGGQWLPSPPPLNKSYKTDETYTTPSSHPPSVQCPCCGSAQIQVINHKWSLATGFLTSKVDRVCVACKHKF